MISRVWALAGLACGVLAGLAILAAAVALAPDTGTARATGSSPVSSLAPAPGGGTAAAPPSPAGSGGVTSFSTPSASPSAGASGAIHVGESAPDLALPQVGGGAIDLASLRGRPVWVTFVSSACEPCRDQLSLMGGFLARYGSSGLVVLAIDVRDSESAAAALATKAGVTFPFGLDLEGRAQAAWGVPALPSHFWVDSAGLIRDVAGGVADAARMADGLGQILPGVTVTP